MPDMIELHVNRNKNNNSIGKHPVATEAELLDFANKLRVAGDADPLEALLPSDDSNSSSCLIANAVNFSSTVNVLTYDDDGNYDPPRFSTDSGGTFLWGMRLPHDVSHERAKRIADAVDCKLIEVDEWGVSQFVIKLPVEIGNAAHAFDEGAAFTNYRS